MDRLSFARPANFSTRGTFFRINKKGSLLAPLEYLNPDIGILRKWDEEVSPYTDVAASLRYLRLLKPCKAADFALLRPFFIKAAGKSNHLSVLLFQ
ncbi:hypothetical protein [Pseudomonas sp. stari2]|uniref:hypothetical protein n=1 Tax=Pseudomonas sp. Stari2 TaxID=2954814 RepID=UPI00345D8493